MITLTKELVQGFVNEFLIVGFDKRVPVPALHMEWWEEVCNENYKNVAIAAPRGHAKSTAITLAYVLCNVVFRVRDFVVIISDTEKQAFEFLGDIKKELTENEDLIDTFGIVGLAKDREGQIVLEFEDGHLAKLVARGSGQRIRGLKWRGKRPNLVVGDDLENDDIVLNDDSRIKFRKWFFSALMQIGSADCLYRIVGTILHQDACLERLMPAPTDKYTRTDGLKQWSLNPARAWRSVRYEAHNDDFSLILWPDMWPEERLKAKYLEFLEQGFPEGYSMEYRNKPVDESTAYFRRNDFKDINRDRPSGTHKVTYIGVDLAISKSDSAAYSVFSVVDAHHDGYEVSDIRRFRGDSLDIIDTFFALYEKHNQPMFIVEEENIARTIGPILRDEMRKRNMYLSIVTLPAIKDKESRARGFQARHRVGAIRYDTQAEWYPTLLLEMVAFPRSTNKDQVDSIANIFLAQDKHPVVFSPEEQEEEEYEDERRRHGIANMQDYRRGRSRYCGY